MGFFDFLKKKELKQIQELKNKVLELKNDISNIKEYNLDLKKRNDALSIYEQIEDAKKEADIIIGNAKHEARNILQKNQIEVNRLKSQSQDELSEISAQIEHQTKIKEGIIQYANDQAKEILKDLRQKVTIAKDKAEQQIQESINVAQRILSDAENKAKEIVGDAYEMNKDIQVLEQTIQALNNKKNGYSDVYIIPTYTLLDELAENYGFTEAGKDLAQARKKTISFIQNNIAGFCDYVENNRKTTAINFVVDAFNGKVDSILSTIKHNNFGILQQKIIDAYNITNDLGAAFRNARINPDYLEARLSELRYGVLTMELKRKEQEEQRRIREEIKEEERARREYEKALKEAEKEQSIIKRTLEKAQKDFELASENQKQKYEDILRNLEAKLKEAEEKSQRAMSMAQQTKSGHIYIISNIGSFGENVYKIGMTRRLEPTDRVKELGDASVPFPFDIHAMIYTENAPKLEKELHKYFIDNQVNKVNFRKEFFNVSIKEIRQKLEEFGVETKWTMTAEATEYRESLAITHEINTNAEVKKRWENTQNQYIDLEETISEEIE